MDRKNFHLWEWYKWCGKLEEFHNYPPKASSNVNMNVRMCGSQGYSFCYCQGKRWNSATIGLKSDTVFMYINISTNIHFLYVEKGMYNH